MDALYKVKLDVFNGPMDLLLYLVSKEEVDIYDIPISRIVDQYVEYLEVMRSREIDVSGDFIIMASTLMLIKSRMLLPTEEVDLEEEIDPRNELVRQLLEYKKYKALSRALGEKAHDQARRSGRPQSLEQAAAGDIPIEEVSLWDLVRAFSRVLEDTGHGWGTNIIHSDKPISAYISDILDVLQGRDEVIFVDLFKGARTREEAIGLFIGILELTRLFVIRLAQPVPAGEIAVVLIVGRDKFDGLRARNLESVLLDDPEGERDPLWREKDAGPDERPVAAETPPPGPAAAPAKVASREDAAPGEKERAEEMEAGGFA